MSIVTNIINPIVVALVMGGLGLWCIYLFYRGMKYLFPNFSLWLNYTVLAKKFSEKDIEWCVGAVEKDMGIEEVETFLLLSKITPKRVKVIKYLFQKIERKMKGGINKNEQYRKSNEQIEIPKI